MVQVCGGIGAIISIALCDLAQDVWHVTVLFGLITGRPM